MQQLLEAAVPVALTHETAHDYVTPEQWAAAKNSTKYFAFYSHFGTHGVRDVFKYMEVSSIISKLEGRAKFIEDKEKWGGIKNV